MLGRGCLKILCWQRCFAGDGALLAKMSLDVIHIRIELTVNVNAPALFNLTSQGTSRDKIFVSSRGKKINSPTTANLPLFMPVHHREKGC